MYKVFHNIKSYQHRQLLCCSERKRIERVRGARWWRTRQGRQEETHTAYIQRAANLCVRENLRADEILGGP